MSLWPLLEPLLDRVERPARYIGCEGGAQTPDHTPDKVAWLLCYPDTYEVGLPNQGLQILYEILNERADAVAERDYAPWGEIGAICGNDASSFSRSNAPAGRRLRRCVQPVAGSLHQRSQCIDLPAGRTLVRPVRTDPHRHGRGHAPTPDPLADFVDASDR